MRMLPRLSRRTFPKDGVRKLLRTHLSRFTNGHTYPCFVLVAMHRDALKQGGALSTHQTCSWFLTPVGSGNSLVGEIERALPIPTAPATFNESFSLGWRGEYAARASRAQVNFL